MLISIESEVVGANRLGGVLRNQRGIGEPGRDLPIGLGELEDRAEERVRHKEVAVAIFGDAIGEREAVGDGRHLMSARIDLEYSAMRLNVVGLVENIERAVLPQLAQQADRSSSRRGRNRNDVDEA